MTGRPVGVVTGLAREQRCFEFFSPERRPRLACAGVGPVAASAGARELLEAGCGGLVSFGLAGALQPSVPVGTLILAEAVVTPQGTVLEPDGGWRHRLLSVCGTARGGLIAGIDSAVSTPAEKAALAAAAQALAADMESHAVAGVACAAGVPFVVIRAVSDGSEDGVPRWLLAALDDTGRPRIPAILSGLLRRPGDLPALVRLGRGAATGIASLRRFVRAAGPRLQFDA